MASGTPQLHIFFLPFMAQGHIIPTLDMAKLFASRGARSTIITTPLNAQFFEKAVERSKNSGHEMEIKILNFPSEELGLPKGCENLDFLISNPNLGVGNMTVKFFLATKCIKQQLEDLIEETRPDGLVAGMFFPWATESAEKFGIPRLVFHGTSFFALCALECVRLYEPHKRVSSDSEPFLIPNLPGEITMTAKEMEDSGKGNEKSDMNRLMKEVRESETKSYGVLLNSFYELEPAYADFYRNDLGRRAWHIGPVSLCNRGIEEKANRGKKASIDQSECLQWLDSKQPNSVVYLSFGSLTNFTDGQLMEIAIGLECSGQDFIWAVKKEKTEGEKEEWLPDGFKERTKGKGLIIQGWAPQVLILDHKAIGGFVTHCGWNSVLEGISAGVPMVTWPAFAEQFYNEKLVTQVLKTGVSVGVQQWVRLVGDFVSRDKVEKAVREVMEGEEAEDRRKRAQGLAELAKAAVEKDGSSWSDLNRFMEELRLLRTIREDGECRKI